MKYSRTKNFCSHRSSSSGSLPCLLRQVQMYASIANPLVRCWVLVFQLSITVGHIQSSIICLGFFALFHSIFRSISVPIAVSLLLACVRYIPFVSFLLFVTGIFPLQSLPALLCFLYVLARCFSVFFSTIALQKFQVILYPLVS